MKTKELRRKHDWDVSLLMLEDQRIKYTSHSIPFFFLSQKHLSSKHPYSYVQFLSRKESMPWKEDRILDSADNFTRTGTNIPH